MYHQVQYARGIMFRRPGVPPVGVAELSSWALLLTVKQDTVKTSNRILDTLFISFIHSTPDALSLASSIPS
jgi:hypothetical protein